MIIQRRGLERDAVMIGRLVIPKDTDRDEYVNYCLMNHVVGVMMPNGDYLRECPVAYSYMGANDGMIYGFDFPKDSDTLGSSLVLITLPQTNQAIVIGCITKRNPSFQLTEEEQIILRRSRDDDNGYNYSEINVRGLRGIIDLIARSESDGGGKINIRAKNNDETGEILMRKCPSITPF